MNDFFPEVYERAIDCIVDNRLEVKFKDLCLKIVNDRVNTGWFFHDGLVEIYYGHFDD